MNLDRWRTRSSLLADLDDDQVAFLASVAVEEVLPPDTTVFKVNSPADRFYLIDSGGMGTVFEANQISLNRQVALKVLPPELASEPERLERFEREVQLTALLTHPNTVAIYDYGRTEDGVFYYVMELLSGMDLKSLVERFGPLPAGRTIYILRQACQSLAEAHAAGRRIAARGRLRFG